MRVVHCLAALIVGLFVWVGRGRRRHRRQGRQEHPDHARDRRRRAPLHLGRLHRSRRLQHPQRHLFTAAARAELALPANTAWRRCPIPSSSAAAMPSTAPTWSARSAGSTATAASVSRPAMPAPSSRWSPASAAPPASSSRAPRPARRRRLCRCEPRHPQRRRRAPHGPDAPRPAVAARGSLPLGAAVHRQVTTRSHAPRHLHGGAIPATHRVVVRQAAPRVMAPAPSYDSRYYTEWYLRR